MQELAAEPDTISYNASISACEKGFQVDFGLELLQTTLEVHTKDPPFFHGMGSCEIGHRRCRSHPQGC